MRQHAVHGSFGHGRRPSPQLRCVLKLWLVTLSLMSYCSASLGSVAMVAPILLPGSMLPRTFLRSAWTVCFPASPCHVSLYVHMPYFKTNPVEIQRLQESFACKCLFVCHFLAAFTSTCHSQLASVCRRALPVAWPAGLAAPAGVSRASCCSWQKLSCRPFLFHLVRDGTFRDREQGVPRMAPFTPPCLRGVLPPRQMPLCLTR